MTSADTFGRLRNIIYGNGKFGMHLAVPLPLRLSPLATERVEIGGQPGGSLGGPLGGQPGGPLGGPHGGKNEESGPPTSHSLSSTTLSRTTRRSARLLLRHRFIFTVPPLHFCGQKVEQCLAEHQQAKSAWRGSSSQLNGCAIQSCVDSNQKTPPGHSGFEGHHNCLEFKTEVAKKHQNANKPPRFVSDLALLDASKLDDGTADE
ncbi:hypothetical protein niasHT_022705 [Heterodera trifolii]|uniref:Uncharacterized protein n=1 Tax=Heterodera trifolii TaxID=157864 RepID=A0ABD2KMS0_9BILA